MPVHSPVRRLELWLFPEGRLPQRFGAIDMAATGAVEQYALVASEDGMYPVMEWGFKEPQGEIWLNRGDVWKYGQTQNPLKRYPQSFMDNTGEGLRYLKQLKGTRPEALTSEK